MRAAEKIIDGLTTLMEGFVELQTKIEEDFDADGSGEDGEGDDPEVRLEIDAAIVTELRATIEAVMDSEDYGADEIATFISIAQDALEEIDPDVFESITEEEGEEAEEETEYEDDDADYDFDDDDLDEDLDEDDDEEEEDEDEDDDDDDDD